MSKVDQALADSFKGGALRFYDDDLGRRCLDITRADGAVLTIRGIHAIEPPSFGSQGGFEVVQIEGLEDKPGGVAQRCLASSTPGFLFTPTLECPGCGNTTAGPSNSGLCRNCS